MPMTKSKLQIASTSILIISCLFLNGTQSNSSAQEIPPVLEIPQTGLDDTSTYRGYTTRFYKDSAGNTLQIYLNQNHGRVVNLWADAANESISFTGRDRAGQPAILTWDSPSAKATSEGKTRYIEYTLASTTPMLEVGLFVLNTMRLERDFQYLQRHTLPFDSEPFTAEELTRLISNLEQLPENVRQRHLALLNARSLEEIRARLNPKIKRQSPSRVLVEQLTFDGKNRLSLELSVDGKEATIDIAENKISIHSLQGQSLKLTIKVGTDSPALTPLQQENIFNSDFWRFYERAKAEHDSLRRRLTKEANKDERLLHFKRLERQVKSMELMSTQEKLLAGLPNYATYFGRDMMMSALMLEPVGTPAMLEHVIASVLKKLSLSGEVSHEEGLGGQAIREHAAKYNQLIAAYFQQKSDKIFTDAETLLGNMQAVTENYQMVDDDFQLSVLTARYLSRADIPADRKRAFLQANSGKPDGVSRLTLLLRNLLYVSQVSRAYVTQPVTENLISFRKLDESRWHAGSWRDSGAGYANGRFAMDINVVWAPKALESVGKILTTLRGLGMTLDEIQTLAPDIRGTQLIEYAQNPEALPEAIEIWRGAGRYFEIRLNPQEIQQSVRAKLEWLPPEERAYWQTAITKSAADKADLKFLAIALDAKGQPIPVANTDVGTWLFLENATEKILRGEIKPEEVIKRLEVFVTPYPVGLLLEGVGVTVANDAYASSEVWESFNRDLYHSPRVIWGREVNLLCLGLARQIHAAYDSTGRLRDASLNSFVRELRAILDRTFAAVEASGLKHSELWSYRIEAGKLLPSRYATSTDIQLWNLTDLAVQYALTPK